MFSDFDIAFKRPQFDSDIPQAILDTLSSELPGDFYYVPDSNGYCHIEVPEGFNLESGRVLLTDQMRSVLPKNYTIQDIQAYSYNSQSDIIIVPDEDGCFKISGQRVKATDIVKAPLKDFDFRNVRFCMKPPEFPEPFKIEVSGDGYKEELTIKRAPENRLYIQSYESIDELPLSIKFYLGTESDQETFSLTLNIDIEKAHYVIDVISAIHIYNAFFAGAGEINGDCIEPTEIIEESKISENTVKYWDGLFALENCLAVKFDISEGIDYKTDLMIERLYRCLIEKKPYKNYEITNNILGTTNGKQLSELNGGEKLYFELGICEQWEVFKTNFEVYGICGIFNACINKKDIQFDEETKEYKFKLTSGEEERMFESVMLFLTDQEAEAFKNNEDHINVLCNAQEIEMD